MATKFLSKLHFICVKIMEGKGKSTKKKKMKITDKKKMEKHMAYCSSIGNL